MLGWLLWQESPRDGKQHWEAQPTLGAAGVLQLLACSCSGSPWTRSLPLTEERNQRTAWIPSQSVLFCSINVSPQLL